jgi:hypothetical protein
MNMYTEGFANLHGIRALNHVWAKCPVVLKSGSTNSKDILELIMKNQLMQFIY